MRKGLKTAAILLPLLLLTVAAGIVIKVNAGLSRRLTVRLPLLAAQIPGVASYSHKAVRYNILTDALVIDDATLEFSGRSARIFWEALKIKGLRGYLSAEVNWAEADWPVIKSAELRGLGLESGGKTYPAMLVCRELEIKRLTVPRLELVRK